MPTETGRWCLSFAAFAAFTLAAHASAQLALPDTARWRVVSRGTDGSVAYVDRSLPVRLGTKRIAWSLWIYGAGLKIDVTGDTSKAAQHLWRKQYDCHLQRTATLSSTLYDGDGQVIRSQTYDLVTETKWEDVRPGSMGEMVLAEVCRKP